MSNPETLKEHIQDFLTNGGVPASEASPDFIIKMLSAMMVSYHKYGLVREAYPMKFNATDDVRLRMTKYRETGNKHYLVDAANFAMIEAMHPSRTDSAWGSNEPSDSPGRVSADSRKALSEDNHGNRISKL
jgi:hypothetical protein